jgi:hypothetical protein
MSQMRPQFYNDFVRWLTRGDAVALATVTAVDDGIIAYATASASGEVAAKAFANFGRICDIERDVEVGITKGTAR